MCRNRAFIALLLAVTVGVVAPAAALAAPSMYPDRYDTYGRSSYEVDVGLFYDDLDPYGDWIEQDDYGWVFAPRVSHGWRPYTVGHWVWTDEYGWLWVSDEDFGWATYHYGRWLPDPRYGWIWVPGYEWGPAWVSWRSGGGYIGWAPLPPRVRWQAGVGFNVGGSRIDAFIAPERYDFVEERAFVEPRVHRRILPSSRAVVVIDRTDNVTNYRPQGRRDQPQREPGAHRASGRPPRPSRATRRGGFGEGRPSLTGQGRHGRRVPAGSPHSARPHAAAGAEPTKPAARAEREA